MNKRPMKWVMVAGFALLLALPAAAYSQLGAPGPWPPASPDGLTPQDGPAEFSGSWSVAAGQQHPGMAAQFGPRGRSAAQRGRVAAPSGRRSDTGGRRIRPGLAGVPRGRGGAARPSLAARALAQSERITLTDEQRQQILAAQHGFREASINRGAEIRIAELDLRELMRVDSPDISAVEAKMREISEHRIAARTGALRFDAAVSEILTTEQVEQLGQQRLRPRAGDDRRGRPDRGPRRAMEEPVEGR